MAAIALEDSVNPRIASRVDKSACEKLAIDERVVDERWNVAAAKNDAEVTVVCRVANYSMISDCTYKQRTATPTLRSRSDSASALP